jgi:hydroxyethylthiazole kinase-like uncharacterized protein yjeF
LVFKRIIEKLYPAWKMSHDLPPLPPRPFDAHKGSMGRVVFVVGSRGMAGAAALAVEASLRAGVGYAVACIPGSIGPDLTAAVPSALQCLCGDAKTDFFHPSHAAQVAAELPQAQSLVIGPGLGRADATGEFFRALLMAVGRDYPDLPVVFDADGLYHLRLQVGEALPLCGARPALSNDGQKAKDPLVAGIPIITPHPGEAAFLLGGENSAASVQANRQFIAQELADAVGAIALLKGAGTWVAAPTHSGILPWQNQTGNAGMATAGSGDVLSGLLGALIARGMHALDATKLAAHLHGRAGDLAAAALGQDSLIASDLISYLPPAIQEHLA